MAWWLSHDLTPGLKWSLLDKFFELGFEQRHCIDLCMYPEPIDALYNSFAYPSGLASGILGHYFTIVSVITLKLFDDGFFSIFPGPTST